MQLAGVSMLLTRSAGASVETVEGDVADIEAWSGEVSAQG